MSKPDISVCGYELDELRRCRYRLWHCMQRGIRPSSLLTEGFAEAVLKPGIEFEAKIMSRFEWQRTAESLKQVMDSDAELIKHPNLTATYNYKRIYHRKKVKFKEEFPVTLIGVPDLLVKNPLDPRYYCPVDIKHHGRVTISDLERILFYSFIMRSQTYRNDERFLNSKARRIHGFVWLSSKPADEASKADSKIIPIPNSHYELKKRHERDWKSRGWPLGDLDDDYKRYLEVPQFASLNLLFDIKEIAQLHRTSSFEEIKLGRSDDPSLRGLQYLLHQITEECSKCKLRRDCLKVLTEREDLSVLREIGPTRKAMLQACKLESIKQLYDITQAQNDRPSVEKLDRALSEKFGTAWKRKFNVAAVSLEKLALLAKSLMEDRMLVNKTFHLPTAPTEVYLDLEYGTFPFCVGMKAVTGKTSNKFQKFIDDEKEAENVIEEARNLFPKHYVAYVWRGEDTKIMRLTGATIDAFDIVNKYFFMPLKSYNVKDVARYLGHIPPQIEITNGLHCSVKFNQYLTEKDQSQKQHIREQILRYNWHDVEALHFIVREVKKFASPVS